MGYIDANNLGYSLDDSTRIFSGLSFSLNKEKTGLVGVNGVGKTTLLKISGKYRDNQRNKIIDNLICPLLQTSFY